MNSVGSVSSIPQIPHYYNWDLFCCLPKMLPSQKEIHFHCSSWSHHSQNYQGRSWKLILKWCQKQLKLYNLVHDTFLWNIELIFALFVSTAETKVLQTPSVCIFNKSGSLKALCLPPVTFKCSKIEANSYHDQQALILLVRD